MVRFEGQTAKAFTAKPAAGDQGELGKKILIHAKFLCSPSFFVTYATSPLE
jgi:hypothetical protein